MPAKTFTGVSFFDEEYGGLFHGRTALVTGRSGTGKSVLGLQFIGQGLQQRERCLLISSRAISEILAIAVKLDTPFQTAIDTGDLFILEYRTDGNREENILLPPESFLQLKELVETHTIQRIVIDTILPWMTLPDPDYLPEHIFSLIRALEQLRATTLLTLPEPASSATARVRNIL